MGSRHPERGGAPDHRTALRAYAAARRFPPAVIERCTALGEADGRALWEVVERLGLGGNYCREFLEWAEEIALRDGTSIARVFERPEVHSGLTRRGSRNERLAAVRSALRRLRYPRLVQREQAARQHAASLGLGPAVHVRFPRDLEGDALTVEITASSPAELARSVERVGRAVTEGCFARLFDLLDEDV